MKKWVQKAIVQKTISFLPFGRNINYLFQRFVTKGVLLNDNYFLPRLKHFKTHIENYQKHTNKPYPNSSLELGTGWYPIIPICFFLAGTENIYTIDINPLVTKQRLIKSIELFIEKYNNEELQKYINIKSERWEKLCSIYSNINTLDAQTILSEMSIHYLVEDARNLSLDDNSIDFISSNNTFEHIPEQVLEAILLEFKRIIKSNSGLMSHFIDMTDHFSHFDKTITIYNFLRFSEKQWKVIDNSIQPQNRLRVFDYLNLYQKLNISISEEQRNCGNLKALQKIKLDKGYKKYDLAELAVCEISLVSKM